MAKQRSSRVSKGMKGVADIAIPRTAVKKIRLFDPSAFLTQAGLGRTIVELKKGHVLFSQGEAAEAVFYIQSGKIRVSVISTSGKEATITLLGEKSFLGEECIANSQPL